VSAQRTITEVVGMLALMALVLVLLVGVPAYGWHGVGALFWLLIMSFVMDPRMR
jgi:hypothetical protein